MQTLWVTEGLDYDGRQLRAHWLLDRFGLVGDALVGFRGACKVSDEEMADLEDLGGPGIAADDMVHFVWECFSSSDLLLATHRQRLLAAQTLETLRGSALPPTSVETATTCSWGTPSCRSRSQPSRR